jgi:hypothetical protein
MYYAKFTARFSCARLTLALASLLIGSSADHAAAQNTSDLPLCGPNSAALKTRLTVSSPTVGEEQEVEIGGSVLSTKEVGITVANLRLSAEAILTGKRAGADYLITIPAGTFPTARFSDLYPVGGATFRYAREKGERRGLSKPDISIYLDPNDDTVLMARLSFGFSKQDLVVSAAKFTLDRCLLTEIKGFRQEILYSGGGKGTVTLQYREYMNDYARPAFSQELSYDLADGNEIGFKGARIRVIKVSNTGIRYVVLKPLTK